MKNVLASCSAAVLFLATSAALAGGPEVIPVQEDYFTGFYVGGTAAGHSLTSDQNVNFFSADPIILGSAVFNSFQIVPPIMQTATLEVPAGLTAGINTDDSGALKVYGGVQGGVNFTFMHRWVLGIAGFGEWNNQTASESANSTVNPTIVQTSIQGGVPAPEPNVFTVTANNSNLTTNVSTKVSNDYGVKGKLGWLATPTTMLYGVVGASWASIKVSGSVNGNISATASDANSGLHANDSVTSTATVTGSTSTTDTKVGWVAGAGIEQFVYEDIISVNLEYNYTNYGTVNTGPADVTVTGTSVTTETGSSPTSAPINQTLPDALSASGNATVSTILAGVNFYFGRNWL